MSEWNFAVSILLEAVFLTKDEKVNQTNVIDIMSDRVASVFVGPEVNYMYLTEFMED